MSGGDTTHKSDMPARPGSLPPRHATKLDVDATQKGPNVPAFSGRLPLRCASQAVGAEMGLSCLLLTGCPQPVTGGDLLVLPPMPLEIFEELTSLFDDQ